VLLHKIAVKTLKPEVKLLYITDRNLHQSVLLDMAVKLQEHFLP